MNNDKNKTNNCTTPIDPKKVDSAKKESVWSDSKKDGTKVTEPHKDGAKMDPKKDETIKH